MTQTGQKKLSPEQAKKKAVRKKRKNRLAGWLILAVVVVALAFVCSLFLLTVQRVVIEGDGSVVYTAEDGLEAGKALGIRKGSPLFAFDGKKLEKDAVYLLSDFDKVDIRRRLPDTVVLRVKESTPVFCTTIGSQTYLLSRELRVLKRLDNAKDAEVKALRHVTFSSVDRCVCGEFLTTSDGTAQVFKRLCGVLEEENMFADADAFDLTNRFDIRFGYRSRFTAVIGDAMAEGDLVTKLRYLRAIVDDRAENDGGYIDVSDENLVEGIVKTYS